MAVTGAPELEELARQLDENARRVEGLLASVSDEQLRWQPLPGAWSISECIDHLSVTAREYLAPIGGAVAKSRSAGAVRRRPGRLSFLGNFFLSWMEPPVRKKFPVPVVFSPSARARETLLGDFRSARERLLEALATAAEADLRTKLTSPAARFIRFNLYDAFAILAAHERRHLWQADQIRRAPGFPQS